MLCGQAGGRDVVMALEGRLGAELQRLAALRHVAKQDGRRGGFPLHSVGGVAVAVI